MSIETYCEQLDAIERAARELFRGLTDAQLNWQPNPADWSIGQCVSHLVVSGRAELPFLDRAIREGREGNTFGNEPFRYGLLGNWFVRLMDAPAKMKFKAPKVYWLSTGRFTVESSAEAFFSLQNELKHALKESAGLHLAKIRVATPVTRFITFSLGQEFALILAHERRHLWQAQRIKDLI